MFFLCPSINFSWIYKRSVLLCFALCSCLRSRCHCRTAPSLSRSALPITRPAAACPSWMSTDKSTPSSDAPCQQHKPRKCEPSLSFHIISKPVEFRFKILLGGFHSRIGELCVYVHVFSSRVHSARELPLF